MLFWLNSAEPAKGRGAGFFSPSAAGSAGLSGVVDGDLPTVSAGEGGGVVSPAPAAPDVPVPDEGGGSCARSPPGCVACATCRTGVGAVLGAPNTDGAARKTAITALREVKRFITTHPLGNPQEDPA